MAVKMEDKKKIMEEKLREYCCIGDESKVKSLIGKGVNVNAANRMNGWTPLHWAAKRGHKNIVEYLLKKGAAKTLKTSKGETASSFASNPGIKEIIGMADDVEVVTTESLPIVPNYIKNPGFMYLDGDSENTEHQSNLPFGLGRNLRDAGMSSPVKHPKSSFIDPMTSPPRKTIALDDGRSFIEAPRYDLQTVNGAGNYILSSPMKNIPLANELVLKTRVANSIEDDFIEIEIEFENLTYENLVRVCCTELGIETSRIKKIRKLPNTIVRKDKDVARLQHFQELEIVLHS